MHKYWKLLFLLFDIIIGPKKLHPTLLKERKIHMEQKENHLKILHSNG